MRNYLDTDDASVDGYGFPLKRLLAHQFMDKYLSQSGQGCDLFSESLKNSLFNALGNSSDVSLLCMAQDIVLEVGCFIISFIVLSNMATATMYGQVFVI